MRDTSWGFRNGPQTLLESLAAIICLPSLILAAINWGLYYADVQIQLLLYAAEVFLMNLLWSRKPVVLFLAVLNLFLIYVPWGILIPEPWNLQYDDRPGGWDGRLDDILRFWFFCSYPAFVWIFLDLLKLTNAALKLAASVIRRDFHKLVCLVWPELRQRLQISSDKFETHNTRLDSDSKASEAINTTVTKAPVGALSMDSRPPSPINIDFDELRKRKLTPIKGMQDEIEKLRASINGVNARINTKVGSMDQQISYLESKVDGFPPNRDKELEEARFQVAQLQQEIQDLRLQMENPMLEMKTKIQSLDAEILQLATQKHASEKTIQAYAAQAQRVEELSFREQRRVAAYRIQYGRARRTGKASFRSGHRKPERLLWAKPKPQELMDQILGDLLQQQEQGLERQESETQGQEEKRQEETQQEQQGESDLKQGSANSHIFMERPVQEEDQQTPDARIKLVDLGNREEENLWPWTDKCLEMLDQEEDKLNQQLDSQLLAEQMAVKTDSALIDPPPVKDAEISNPTIAKEDAPEMEETILGEKSQLLEPSPPEPANSLEAETKLNPSDNVGSVQIKPKFPPVLEEIWKEPQDGGLFAAVIPEVASRSEELIPQPLDRQQSCRPEPLCGMVGELHCQHNQQVRKAGSTKSDISMTDVPAGSDWKGEQGSGFPYSLESGSQADINAPQQETASEHSWMSFTYDEEDIDMSELPQESMGSFIAEIQAGHYALPRLQTDVPLQDSPLSPPTSEDDQMSESSANITHESIEWEETLPLGDESADLEMSVANDDSEGIEPAVNTQEIVEGPSQYQFKTGTHQQSSLQTIPEQEEDKSQSDPGSSMRGYHKRMTMRQALDPGSSDSETEWDDDGSSDNEKRESMAYLQAMLDSDDENPIRKSMLQELDELLEESDPELEDGYDPETITATETPEPAQIDTSSGSKNVNSLNKTGEITSEAGSERMTEKGRETEGNSIHSIHTTSSEKPRETAPPDSGDELSALEILEADLHTEFEKLEEEGLLPPPSNIRSVPNQPQNSGTSTILAFKHFPDLASAKFSFGDTNKSANDKPRTSLVRAMHDDAMRHGYVPSGYDRYSYNKKIGQEPEIPRRATDEEMAGRKKSQLSRRFKLEGMFKSLAGEGGPINEPVEVSEPQELQTLGAAKKEAKVVESVAKPADVPAPEPPDEEPDIYSADG